MFQSDWIVVIFRCSLISVVAVGGSIAICFLSVCTYIETICTWVRVAVCECECLGSSILFIKFANYCSVFLSPCCFVSTTSIVFQLSGSYYYFSLLLLFLLLCCSFVFCFALGYV